MQHHWENTWSIIPVSLYAHLFVFFLERRPILCFYSFFFPIVANTVITWLSVFMHGHLLPKDQVSLILLFMHARCSLDFCLKQGTQLVFSWCTGTLWVLLGFWCSGMPVWSLLHPFWHGWFLFQIIDFMPFINLHFSDWFFVCPYQNISLSVNDLLACCGFMCGDGCDGGYPIYAWRYFVQSGVVTEQVSYFSFCISVFLWFFDLIDARRAGILLMIAVENAMNLFF